MKFDEWQPVLQQLPVVIQTTANSKVRIKWVSLLMLTKVWLTLIVKLDFFGVTSCWTPSVLLKENFMQYPKQAFNRLVQVLSRNQQCQQTEGLFLLQAKHFCLWPLTLLQLISSTLYNVLHIRTYCRWPVYATNLVKWLCTYNFCTVPFLTGYCLRQLTTAKHADTIWILWRSRLGWIHEWRRHHDNLNNSRNNWVKLTPYWYLH